MRTRNLIVFTLALATSVTFALLARGEAAADGKAIFMAQKCNMCHSVPSAEITRTTTSEKMAGPDLMGAMEKDQIPGFLKKEVKDANGKLHGKTFGGTPEELSTLADWLVANKKPA